MTWKELQQDDTRDRRRQSWSRDSVNENHGNVAGTMIVAGRCGSTSTNHFENADKKGETGVEKECRISSSFGQLLKGLRWRDRGNDEGKARLDGDA